MKNSFPFRCAMTGIPVSWLNHPAVLHRPVLKYPGVDVSVTIHCVIWFSGPSFAAADLSWVINVVSTDDNDQHGL